MPRVLGGSCGGKRFLMGEVPFKSALKCMVSRLMRETERQRAREREREVEGKGGRERESERE